VPAGRGMEIRRPGERERFARRWERRKKCLLFRGSEFDLFTPGKRLGDPASSPFIEGPQSPLLQPTTRRGGSTPERMVEVFPTPGKVGYKGRGGRFWLDPEGKVTLSKTPSSSVTRNVHLPHLFFISLLRKKIQFASPSALPTGNTPRSQPGG